jgi:hypothetical protein
MIEVVCSFQCEPQNRKPKKVNNEQKILKPVHKWHQTKLGLIFFGLVELSLAYAFISLAIDRGNLLYYLLATIFLIGKLK